MGQAYCRDIMESHIFAITPWGQMGPDSPNESIYGYVFVIQLHFSHYLLPQDSQWGYGEKNLINLNDLD